MSQQNHIIQEDAGILCRELESVLLPLAGSTLLITGGSGFLGSYLLDTIAYANDHVFDREKPCRVITVDNLQSGINARTAHLRGRGDFRFLERDVSRPLDLGEPVHRILHAAGIASPTFYRRFPMETIDVNVTGTRLMLEMARDDRSIKSVLHLSTSEIYGDPDPAHIPTREDYRGYVSCTGPRACYDESKRLSETLCVCYHELYKVPVKVVRPFNVYGPGQRLDDKRVVPDLMSAALERKPLVLFSDGRPTRAFCYIRDFTRALWMILMSDENGEAFNVGNDEAEISMRELAETVRKVAGEPWIDVRFELSEDVRYLSDNPQRRCPDLSKLRSRFGYKPTVSVEEGLRRTLLSYQPAPQTVGGR